MTTHKMEDFANRFGGSDQRNCSASPEYSRGVNDACEWLENYVMTKARWKLGVRWARECPRDFAWLIRNKLLDGAEITPPNVRAMPALESAAEQQKGQPK